MRGKFVLWTALALVLFAGCATQNSQSANYDGKDADCPECGEVDQGQPARYPAASPGAVAAVQGLGYDGPMPLRSAAKIMRVWVAPYESTDRTLHMAAYLYAEVEERQWSIGERRLEVAPHITPLEDRELPAPPDKDRKPQPRKPGARQTPSSSPFPALDPKKLKNSSQSSFFDRKKGEVKKDNLLNQMDQK